MTINHSAIRSFQQSSTVLRCRASGEGNERPPGFTSREEGGPGTPSPVPPPIGSRNMPPGARPARLPPQKRQGPFLGPRLAGLRAGRLKGVTDGWLHRGRGNHLVRGRRPKNGRRPGSQDQERNRGLPSPWSARIAFGKPARAMLGGSLTKRPDKKIGHHVTMTIPRSTLLKIHSAPGTAGQPSPGRLPLLGAGLARSQVILFCRW